MKRYVIILILFLTTVLFGQNEVEKKTYHVKRANPHPPVIDGKADDAAWKIAVYGDGFIQRDPVEGDPSSEKTFFKILYDEKNLYVLIRAYDSEPDKIVHRLARRDEVYDSDVLGILLDSYFDHRTAFEFSVNAGGVRKDAIFTNDQLDDDTSWDPVWEVKTSIDDSGWVAEMRIPFSQLRFAKKDKHTWGLEIYRYIHRKQEYDVWQLIPKDAGGFVSYFGYLKGLESIRTPRRIELLPYSVSRLETYPAEEGNPFANGRDFGLTGGLDGKISVTGNLTVDFTINPDFGQVEADPSEVNLTAFETYFEEKRPFFIEGKNIFQFPLALGDGDFSRESLFYSRRIGRAPHREPDLSDDEYAETPRQTSILGAAKLSGKTDNGISIGILDAVTAEEKARIDRNGTRREETVEPLTNYFVARLQKDFREGSSSIGGMVTATHRNINHSYLNFLNRSAYTGGIDLRHQWQDKTYFIDCKFAFSHLRGDKEAILETQTASARYFQRPDADYVTLDSNRTQLTGHGGSINIGKGGNGRWRYAIGGLWRSPELELNDLGYLRYADRILQYIWVGYRIYNPIGIFRRISVNANQWQGWNFGGEKLFTGANINGGGQFVNYWGFHTGINREAKGLSLSALRGGPALWYEGAWNNWFNIYSDSRKKWQVSISGFNSWNDDKITRVQNYRISFSLKPTNMINLSINPFYSNTRDDNQYVDTIEKNGDNRYILAQLDQKTLGIVFRFNICLFPGLTLQYYGQPFVSAGRYQRFKKVTDSRNPRYDKRYHVFSGSEISYDAENEEYRIDEDRDGNTDYTIDFPDFNFKQFRSNLVIRWEYQPGSLVYLVWSQGRTGIDEYGDFSAGRDLRDLFRVSPENVFLIKINHWFSL